MTGFEWDGSAGFRTPDSILIEWEGKNGDLEEGIVGINESWEKFRQTKWKEEARQ